MSNLTSGDRRLVHAMQTLGDPTRFKMFKLLLADQKLCVSEIAGKLQISVPAVSQHFKTFELIGLVDKQRNGQKICYTVKQNDKFVNKLTQVIN